MGKRTRRVNVPGGRFDLREIAARVERRMKEMGLSPKQVYTELKMSKGDWSKKVHNDGSHFSVGEIDAIATILQAPRGWPFLDDTLINILERALDGAAGHHEPAHPPAASEAARARKRGTGGGRT